jgi:hypothetical protein
LMSGIRKIYLSSGKGTRVERCPASAYPSERAHCGERGLGCNWVKEDGEGGPPHHRATAH